MTRRSRRKFLIELREKLCAKERNIRECSQPTLQAMCRVDATSKPAALPNGKRTTYRMRQANKTRNQCFNSETYTCGTCAETVCCDCLKSSD